MRQAPPVGVTLSGGGAWRAAGPLLALLAAAATVEWALAHLAMPLHLRIIADLSIAAGTAVLAWWRGRPRPRQLQWDGSHWSLDGLEGTVAVMWDLGGWLLLRHWPATGRATWLPLPEREAGPAWHALRAALHARPVPAPLPGTGA